MFHSALHRDDRDAVFHLEGKLSLEDTANLRKSFWSVINAHPIERLIVNFQNLKKLDSAVISLLVATKNVVSRKNATLILVELHDAHRQFLERTHLHRYFEIQTDLASCLNAP